MAETLGDLNAMLKDLSRVSQQVGLRMNMSKTKIMSNAYVPLYPIIVGSSALEIVDEYIYLGHTIQLGRYNFEKEVNRRIQLGWAAFGKLSDIFSSKIPECLKTFSLRTVRFARDDLRIRDMVANYGPHRKAQSHSAGDGESYVRSIST
ncbi:jg10217 [Pararge aegeria aegeria]|uniref:Jg10217 protein n=1 Tax=Pararge aegeria aegeria TaxID=348720 RepID=A0A8S4SH56_9NEOP|nr:jg10217 [Pararge aegeria aegeria]